MLKVSHAICHLLISSDFCSQSAGSSFYTSVSHLWLSNKHYLIPPSHYLLNPQFGWFFGRPLFTSHRANRDHGSVCFRVRVQRKHARISHTAWLQSPCFVSVLKRSICNQERSCGHFFFLPVGVETRLSAFSHRATWTVVEQHRYTQSASSYANSRTDRCIISTQTSAVYCVYEIDPPSRKPSLHEAYFFSCGVPLIHFIFISVFKQFESGLMSRVSERTALPWPPWARHWSHSGFSLLSQGNHFTVTALLNITCTLATIREISHPLWQNNCRFQGNH